MDATHPRGSKSEQSRRDAGTRRTGEDQPSESEGNMCMNRTHRAEGIATLTAEEKKASHQRGSLNGGKGERGRIHR